MESWLPIIRRLLLISAAFPGLHLASVATGQSCDWFGLYPSARGLPAFAYDSSSVRAVLFGGGGLSGTYLGDTWEWDGSAWMQRTATGPSPRVAATMVYDSGRGRFVLFGGLGSGGYLGDTWEWDGSAWAQRATSGPSARDAHTLAYDTAPGRVVLFGGQGSNGPV